MSVARKWRKVLFRRADAPQRLTGIVHTLPVTLPAALAAFGLVAVAHLLVDQYKVSLILPIGIVAAVAAGYYAHRLSGQGDGRTVAQRSGIDILVLIGVVLWLVFNLVFTSQHLFTNRDPATYNLTGAWLITHETVRVEKPSALATFTGLGLEPESLGFATNPNKSNELQAQGTHVLPALQGLVGKMLGVDSMLRTNVIFGATALLALYGFGRLLVRPQWAALGVLIMALSLPMLFMTRDSYTEPLTMTFLFGGLTLLGLAHRARERWQWWLAGMVLGAAALTRIDAYLTFAGIVLYAIIMLMLAPIKQRQQTFGCVSWLAIGIFLGGYIAWLDISLLSTAYYQAHSQFILPELHLLLGLTVLGVVAVALNWRFNALVVLDKVTARWRNRLLWLSISGFFLVLTSRPIWFVGYQQNSAGAMVRTFSEQTMNWIIWYVGPVIVVAGVAGLVLITIRLLRGKDMALLPFVLAFSVTALLYLLHPSITGDQVWATRRLLPIVIPGFVLLGMWIFERLYNRKILVWRGHSYNLEIITTVLVTLSVVSPLFVTYPFALRRLYVPELAQMQAVCAATPKDAVVIWVGEARFFATQPTRALCGNDSLGLAIADVATLKINLDKVRQQARLSGTQVIIGYFEPDAKLIPSNISKKAQTISDINYNEIEHTYKRAPRNMITLERKILMGQLN